MAKFVGIIHKEEDSDYGVCFPDFPGCVTAGTTMQEAFDMAGEALQGHIDVMHEYREELPQHPLTLDEARVHEFALDAVTFFMIDADLPIKSKRINITLDERLIEEIDAISQNRSGFLAEAAREKLRHGRAA